MKKLAKFETVSMSPPKTRDVTTGIEYELVTDGFPEGYVGFRAYLNGKFVVRCNARSSAPAGLNVWRYEILLRLYRHGFIPYFSNSHRVWEFDRVRFRWPEIEKFRDHVAFLNDFKQGCEELARLRHQGQEMPDIVAAFVRDREIAKRKAGLPFVFANPINRSLVEDVAVDLDTGLTFSLMTRDHGPTGAHLSLRLDGQFICGCEATRRWDKTEDGEPFLEVRFRSTPLHESFEAHRSKAVIDLEGWSEIGSFDEFLPTIARGWQEFFAYQARGKSSCVVSVDP